MLVFGFKFLVLVLYTVMRDTEQWNWGLVDCFLDDSLHERRWVDHASSAALVVNLMTAFGTRLPTENMYTSSELRFPERFSHHPVSAVRLKCLNRELCFCHSCFNSELIILSFVGHQLLVCE